jgi:hypothetical protein
MTVGTATGLLLLVPLLPLLFALLPMLRAHSLLLSLMVRPGPQRYLLPKGLLLLLLLGGGECGGCLPNAAGVAWVLLGCASLLLVLLLGLSLPLPLLLLLLMMRQVSAAAAAARGFEAQPSLLSGSNPSTGVPPWAACCPTPAPFVTPAMNVLTPRSHSASTGGNIPSVSGGGHAGLPSVSE